MLPVVPSVARRTVSGEPCRLPTVHEVGSLSAMPCDRLFAWRLLDFLQIPALAERKQTAGSMGCRASCWRTACSRGAPGPACQPSVATGNSAMRAAPRPSLASRGNCWWLRCVARSLWHTD